MLVTVQTSISYLVLGLRVGVVYSLDLCVALLATVTVLFLLPVQFQSTRTSIA